MIVTEKKNDGTSLRPIQIATRRRGAGIILAVFAIVFLLAAVTTQRGRVQARPGAANAPARRVARKMAPGHIVSAHQVTKTTNTSPDARGRVEANYGKLPLSFEANQGQTAGQVKFLSRGFGYTVFLTANEAVLALNNPAPHARKQQLSPALPPVGSRAVNSMTLLTGPAALDTQPRPRRQVQGRGPVIGTVVRMRLINASASPKIVGGGELPGKSNYLIGKNPKNWRTDVPTYARVRYRDVYPGVDLVYHGNQRQLEYDFVLAPGANPGAIRLRLDAGNSKIIIAKNGDLMIETTSGVVSFRKPVVYQPETPAKAGAGARPGQRRSPGTLRASSATRHLIDGRFALLSENEVGFKIARYDKAKPLIIDPTLVYATYLGGSGGRQDMGNAIAADSAGSAYVAGSTVSADFPTTGGAYQTTFVGGTCVTIVGQTQTFHTCPDAFVTKLNASGTALVYSTFIGGNGYDSALGIAVDSSGAAYVTGSTGSTNFPTVNPIQATNPGTAAFVAKLNAAGNGLDYSTLLAGSMGAFGQAIAIDSAGSAYVTGYTSSMDFPTVNPVQATLGGITDAFVAKLNPAGTALTYSTYLGGTRSDTGNGIAVDFSGYAYVTGTTFSSDFPTVNAFQATYGNNGDAFVAKLDPSGSPLVYSTYLGGGKEDYGYGIATDSSGQAYVAGTTFSSDFPTANAFQAALNGSEDAYITKLNANGSALVYSTYLGGSGGDGARSIKVDPAGSVYVAGGTGSNDFPTVNAFQTALSGLSDSFIAYLNPAGSALDFSTYLGGTGTDNAIALSLDTSGNAYLTGATGVGTFPTTPGAFQTQGPSTGNCALYPSGYIPFTQITSYSSTGDLVVGYTTMALFQQLSTIPLPAFPGEGFCTPAELAAGSYFAAASDPTAAMRNGDFSGFGTITDPTTGQPFPNNTIPSSELGDVFAWPILGGLPPPSDAFVAKISGFPTFNGMVALSPSSVDFGSAVVSNTTSAQTVTLSNSGSSVVNIAAISITGADSGDFSQTNTCASTLAAGSSCTISVTFTPSAAGSRGAMLNVSDDAASSPQMAALSGSGQDFALTARTITLSVAAGASANYDLVMSPQGGFNQAVDLSCSGAPSHSTCSVDPTSVTLDGTNDVPFKLTVSTSANSLLPPAGPVNFLPPSAPLPLSAWLALFSLLGLFVLARFIPKDSRVKLLVSFAALALLVTFWAACGGGSSSSSTSSSNATPAGTYMLTVTATSGSLTQTTDVTLNVQ